MTLLNESRAVDLQLKWAELMVESAQLQCDIAVSKYNSEVFTESENEYILMEAEDAVNKSKGALRKAIDKVIGFIKSVASKIASAFSRKKVQNDLDEIKSAAASDPKLNGLKAQIPDYKQREKDIAEYEKAIQTAKMNAKKNGKISEQDMKNMENAKKKCSAKVPLIAVGVVSTAAAVGALLINVYDRTNKLIVDVYSIDREYSAGFEKWRAEDKKVTRRWANSNNRYDDMLKKIKDPNLLNPNYNPRDPENCDRFTPEARKRIKKFQCELQNKISLDGAENDLAFHELALSTSKAKYELMYSNIFRMLISTLKGRKELKDEIKVREREVDDGKKYIDDTLKKYARLKHV